MTISEKAGKGASTGAGHRKRLKARFRKTALEGFHDYEIVELLLTYAIPRRDVKPVAKEAVRRFGGLKGVFEATYEELAAVDGIGENAAALLTILKEAAFTYLKEQREGKNVIHSPEEAVSYLSGLNGAAGDGGERFLAILLNSKNEILAVETLFEGPRERLSVSPRAVIEKAFKHNARSIIFAHRLPSKRPQASESEKRLLKEIEAAARSVDILVHDHLVIGTETHMSGRKKGWIRGLQ